MSKYVYCYTDEGEYHGTYTVEPNEWTGEYAFPKNSTEKDLTFEEGRTPYFENGEWVNM